MEAKQANNNNADVDDILVSSMIPETLRSLFKFERFNSMQSEIASDVLDCDENLTIASPTGSGKTVIHELAIVRMIMKVASGDIKNFRCVYIAPNKALCQQKTNEWMKTFGSIGVKVMEITGDVDMSEGIQSIVKANIIITTPEKWDNMTRQWRQHLFLFGTIDAILLDEIHHLGDDRGATLEIIIVRMRLLHQLYIDKAKSKQYSPLRVIALSATLPNLGDIGSWLDCCSERIHHFGDDFRPIPLETHVLSFYKAPSCNQFLFEKGLNDKVADVIRKYSDNRQTLIFCASKSGAAELARLLSTKVRVPPSVFQGSSFDTKIAAIGDASLRLLVQTGFAFHHAGLPPGDKDLVEDLYLGGRVHVLCSTSTLAHGVNLPAHCVIIKGTNSWRGGGRGYERSPRSEIIQMTGRAGRPGFDTHGVAVIMTSDDQKDYYTNTTLNADTVESKLPAILIEAICSEITQTVICSLQQAEQWLKSTFLFVRMQQNPRYYALVVPRAAPGSEELKQHYDAMARDCCLRTIKELAAANIITFSESTLEISPLPEAHIMTRNILKFETMKTVMAVPPSAGMKEVLLELCKAEECSTVVRRDEKKTLNHLMTMVRFPLKAKVQTGAQKAYVLTQAVAVNFYIVDFTLRVEQSEIIRWTSRIATALSQLSYERGVGSLMTLCVLIERGLRSRMWEVGFDTVFSQLQLMGGAAGIEATTVKQLVKHNVLAGEDVLYCSPKQLQQRLGGCTLRDAQSIVAFSQALLQLKLSVYATATAGGGMRIDISPVEAASSPLQTFASEITPSYQLIAYDTASSQLLFHRSLKSPLRAVQSFEVPPLGQVRHIDVKVCLLSDVLVGFDALQLNTASPAAKAHVTKAATKAATKAKAAVKSIATNIQAPLVPEEARDAPATGRNSIRAYMREKPPQEDTRGKENVTPAATAAPRFPAQQQTASRIPSNSKSSNPFEAYAHDQSGIGYSAPQARTALPQSKRPPAEPRFVEQQQQPSHSTPVYSQSNGYSRTSSRELDLLRAKACELQLDNVPIKRIRTDAPWRGSVPAAPAGFGSTPSAYDFQTVNPNVSFNRQSSAASNSNSTRAPGRFNYNAADDFEEEVESELRASAAMSARPRQRVKADSFFTVGGPFFDSSAGASLTFKAPAAGRAAGQPFAGSVMREVVREVAAPPAENVKQVKQQQQEDLFLSSFF